MRSKTARVTSLFTFFAFTFSCSITPAQATALVSAKAPQAESAFARRFAPPAELGSVTDAYLAASSEQQAASGDNARSPAPPLLRSPLVIHIQDLHANYGSTM